MILLLPFSTVTAHPGHGNLYPEEVVDDTTNSNTDNNQNADNSGGNAGKSNSDDSSDQNSASQNSASQDKATQTNNEMDNTNQDGNQSIEEVNNTSDTNNTVSEGSESFPWDTAIIVCLIIAGLFGVGFLFKSGRF